MRKATGRVKKTEIRELLSKLSATMTDAQIAARVNVASESVYRWRTGRCVPRPICVDRLRDLASEVQ